MKIVAINTVASDSNAPGGIMSQICKAAMGRGDIVLAVYGRGDAPQDVPNVRVGNDIDILLHAVKSRLYDSSGRHSIVSTKRLIRLLAEFSPDIVHLHNLHGYYINYPLLMQWLKQTGVPVVWTLHDCWAYTGHCAYYTYNRCHEWKRGCRECLFKNAYPKSILASDAEYNFKLKKDLFTTLPNLTIVPVSEWLAKEVGQSFLQQVPRVIIPNGVDTDKFRPRSTSREKKCSVLGVAAKWDSRKNFEFFIGLANLLPDIKITVVGSTTLRQRKIAPKNITIIDRISDRYALSEIYSSVDIFINPSMEETFGMTTIEAMACGVPVIVNNSTAMAEIVTAETGFAVNIDSLDEVQNAIKCIMRKLEAYRLSCRNHAVKNYSMVQMTDNYLDVYDRLHSI